MKKQNISKFEFIALMASLMSITALSIDAILPALTVIGVDIGIPNSNNIQLLITMLFLGLGIGQLIAGPLSDSFGRKPIIYFGFILFLAGSVVSTLAFSLETMIVGRLLQGIGLSAPRTISIAIVRDQFSGNQMARIMSFVTVIFILVPAIAPALGKAILNAWGWKSIFYFQGIIALIVIIWFGRRQVETLKTENKIAFKSKLLIDGAREFFSHKQATLYTLVLGFVTGSFMVFLSSGQKIFEEQYGMADEFPYLFAAIALSIGVATLLNGTFVMKYGMRKLTLIFSFLFTVVPFIYVMMFYGSENPNIYVLMAFFILQFFSLGFLFGNISALALEPVGHIAGIGSALSGFVSTLIAVPIATFTGRYIELTALPMFVGFFLSGLVAILLLYNDKVIVFARGMGLIKGQKTSKTAYQIN